MDFNNDEFIWVEKYRPRTIADTILPERLKNIFQSFVDKKLVPTLMLAGGPGIGKTTAALALCEELKLSYLFINASKERGIDTLRHKIVQYASTVAFNGKPKVIILDEADFLTPEAQGALRGEIEAASQNCTFIFTCNFPAKLIDAIHSRSTIIDFKLTKEEKPKLMVSLLKRLEAILKQEKISYEKKAILLLIERYFPDCRKIINELHTLALSNSIKEDVIVNLVSDEKLILLYKALKNKDFNAMRKWVVTNIESFDAARFFRTIYDSMFVYMKPETIPAAVLLIAKYQYQSAFVPDHELNIVAFLTELMVEVQYL
jgi:DNA polymerase III delta prime subunit